MKTTKILIIVAALSSLIASLQPSVAQGTAFTYQGRLQNNGSPANGLYDFRFNIIDAPAGGTVLAATIITNAITVSNGLFAVTLDFGQGIFTGPARWLEITVSSNNANNFFTLSPRQQLTPTPYAIMANSASNVLGTVAAGQLSGTVSSGNLSGTYGNAVAFNNPGNSYAGNGASLTGVNAATVGGLGTGNFWQTGGNAGTTAGVNYVGTTDNQPLELHVNGARALRLEPGGATGAPSVIGGSPVNFVSPGVVGATIGGGGVTNYVGVIFSSTSNSITADFGTIGGGLGNTIQTDARWATIGGGLLNTIQTSGINSTIGGGEENSILANSDSSTIGGGNDNWIAVNAWSSTIGGGSVNNITGPVGTIPGGDQNLAFNYAFAAGHRAKANYTGSFVWADSTDADFADTAVNQFLLRASGGVVMATPSLRFPGAGADTSTPVFTHKATSANVSGNKTYINNPACNGQPNAMLIITENWTAGDNVGNSKVVGVYYDAGEGQWTIFVDDGTAMPVGVAYNVMVTSP